MKTNTTEMEEKFPFAGKLSGGPEFRALQLNRKIKGLFSHSIYKFLLPKCAKTYGQKYI